MRVHVQYMNYKIMLVILACQPRLKVLESGCSRVVIIVLACTWAVVCCYKMMVVN